MRKYNVTVNGNLYEVLVEEVKGGEAMVAAAQNAAPVQAAPVQAAPAPVAAPVAPSASAGGEQVTSPMPGTILSINVNVGDTVKSGETLVILEAMKMENEIPAPCDGKVLSINVTKGSSVESGALICVIG